VSALPLEQNYFPHDEWDDVYCPHLGCQLGPCEECDNIAYIAYCNAEYDDYLADPLVADYDKRDREPVDSTPHIPLVTFEVRPAMEQVKAKAAQLNGETA
jgi:hypothetical protein